MKNFPEKTCSRCEKIFKPTGSIQTVCFSCSGLHQERFCKFCGKVFVVKQSDNVYCDRACAQQDRVAAVLVDNGNKQICRVCENPLPLEEFREHRRGNTRRTECKNCEAERSQKFSASDEGKEYRRAWQTRNRKEEPEKHLWMAARKRARENNLPFNLDLSDILIPDFCPVLGIPFSLGKGYPTGNSPTIDKIIPSLGYVKGNIAVISYRANSIKRDASQEEIQKIADWIKLVLTEKK